MPYAVFYWLVHSSLNLQVLLLLLLCTRWTSAKTFGPSTDGVTTNLTGTTLQLQREKTANEWDLLSLVFLPSNSRRTMISTPNSSYGGIQAAGSHTVIADPSP